MKPFKLKYCDDVCFMQLSLEEKIAAWSDQVSFRALKKEPDLALA